MWTRPRPWALQDVTMGLQPQGIHVVMEPASEHPAALELGPQERLVAGEQAIKEVAKLEVRELKSNWKLLYKRPNIWIEVPLCIYEGLILVSGKRPFLFAISQYQ